MIGRTKVLLGSWLVLSLFAGMSWAGQASPIQEPIPPCPAYDRELPVNNSQVLHWKRTTANQFRERAHVTGVITQLFDERNGHLHFEIQIGKRDGDVVEIIYNQEFGEVPAIHPGMHAEACGDYITSTEDAGPYPASPDGAIVHWVHKNPSGRGHASGFVALDGHLFGQDKLHAKPHGGIQP